MNVPTEPRALSWAALPLKRESLPDAIATMIAEAIAFGTLAPGDRVVETALAIELGVSRVPVREALKILHTQGIVTGESHKGFRVASFEPRMVASVQEARLEIEALVLRDALLRWRSGAADPGAMDLPIAEMSIAMRTNDVAGLLRADLRFHAAICDAADNPVFATLWRAIARHAMIIFNLARFRDIDLKVVVRRHEFLRDQILARINAPIDVADLRTLLATHFNAQRPGQEAFSPPAIRRRRAGTTPS